MRTMLAGHPLGIWVAIFAILFTLIAAGGGQVLSLVDWDLAVRLGLQEYDRHAADLTQRALAEVEWGTALADVLLILPLLGAGLIGVLCRRYWGMLLAMMGAACWVYMFLAYGAQRVGLAFRAGVGDWGDYATLIGAFALLGLIPSLLTLWGLAANADRFAVPRPNDHRLQRHSDGLNPFALEDWLICAGQVLWTLPQVWILKRQTWNTRPGEAERPLTGDDFVPSGLRLHRAITITRPTAAVWPWVVGFGRGAGYYSWDFLDNPGHRHADYPLDIPEPRVGDWNADLGTIRYLEPGVELVWYDEPVFLGIKAPTAMTFRLDPEGDGACRLHFRMVTGLPRQGLRARLAQRMILLMDQVMSAEMLRRVKLLIETYEQRRVAREVNQSLAPHQKAAWGSA